GAREPAAGLHPHRAREGRVDRADRLPPPAAQRARADRDAARAEPAVRPGRDPHHRAGLQLPGDGAPVLQLGGEPRLPRAARGRRRGDGPGVAAGRPLLRDPRSAGEVHAPVSTAPVLSDPEPGAAPETMAAGQPALRQALHVFAENRLAAIGLGMIVAIALFCFLGPHIWHTDQIHNDILNANQHPSRHHPLGTDPVGYDGLGRLMVGGQTSLEVAFGAAVLAVILGTLWGAIAGYVGGFVDGFMMRVVDALLAIPALFLLLFLAAGTTPSVWMLIFVLGGVAGVAPPRPGARGGATPRARADRAAGAGGGGDGRRAGPDRAAPHHPEHHRRGRGQRHVPGGGCHPDRRGALVPGARDPAAGGQLGRHAHRGPELRLLRLLVADLPAGDRD